MIRTRVGFSDGAEVVQMDFDPEIVSYNSLLDLFWSAHNPTSSNNSRLYQKAIFTHSAEQARTARQSLSALASKSGRRITTTIEKPNFTLARDSEQKYYLRHSQLWTSFLKHYPRKSDITDSAAAAKANGYLAGNSHQEHFAAYASKLGLDSRQLQILKRKVPKTARHFVPKCVLPRD